MSRGSSFGSSGPQSTTVTLTAADVAVLDSVPFELVAAPGAGKILLPVTSGVLATASSGLLPATGTGNLAYASDPSLNQGYNNPSVSTEGFCLNAWAGAPVSDAENYALILSTGSAPPVPGAIATSSLNAGGTGWAVNDNFLVQSMGGSYYAVGVVDTVDGGGAILTYHLTGESDVPPNVANGYLVAIGVALIGVLPSLGADATIDIDTLDYSANPMTLTVKTLYSVMDVPA